MRIMGLLRTIRNTLPTRRTGITNTIGNADQGVGTVGVSLNSTHTSTDMKDLTDLQIVNKTIKNARAAVELDPTTWSSLISLTIAANRDYEINMDEDADPNALTHIKEKVKEWDLSTSMTTTTWKGLVDGRCFIEKYSPDNMSTITDLSHLAFDEINYNFVEVVDPITKEVLGYKQKAKIFPLPTNWETMTLDNFINRAYEVKDTTFTKDSNGFIPVFQPVFFPSDGNSEGLVFKVLDDVYCLKTLKNMMPDAAKMAANTLGVQVGNKDFPFKPYNDSDTTAEKISKAETRMGTIGDNFSEKYQKQVILFDAGITPDMIGNGQLAALQDYNDFFKQEIRSSLLTPDSRFESASSNRAVSQEQMSGSMGQITVVEYIQTNYLASNYERNLFDHELYLAGYQNDMGKIHLDFGEKETDDELNLAQIASTILTIRPDLFELVANEYYPRIAGELPEYLKDNSVNEQPIGQVPESLPPEEAMISNSIKDTNNGHLIYINAAKKLLEEEGVLW